MISVPVRHPGAEQMLESFYPRLEERNSQRSRLLVRPRSMAR